MKNAGWEVERREAGVLAGEAGVIAGEAGVIAGGAGVISGEAVIAGTREKWNKKFFPGDLE